MISLSPLKLLLVAAVIMLLLGPDKLPEVAHRLGAGWRALKRLQEKMEAEVREAIPDLPSASEIARIARSPVSLLNQLADRVDAKEAADSAARTRGARDRRDGGSFDLAPAAIADAAAHACRRSCRRLIRRSTNPPCLEYVEPKAV